MTALLGRSGTGPNEILHIRLDAGLQHPVLDQLARCVREIDPTLNRASREYGPGVTVAALITLAANYAIDHGQTTLIADAFRQNADMLDAETSKRI